MAGRDSKQEPWQEDKMGGKEPETDRRRHIGFQVRRLHQTMGRYMEYMMRRELEHAGCSDLTMLHAWILQYIRECGDTPVYQRDIERRFDMKRPTATAMLQLMERNGYIVRRPVPEDARLKRLVLTVRAERFERRKEQGIEEIERRLRAGIDEVMLDNFFKCVDLLCSNMTCEMQGTGAEKM